MLGFKVFGSFQNKNCKASKHFGPLIFPLLFLVILDVSSECQTATFTINGNTGKCNFYFMPYFFHDVCT